MFHHFNFLIINYRSTFHQYNLNYKNIYYLKRKWKSQCMEPKCIIKSLCKCMETWPNPNLETNLDIKNKINPHWNISNIRKETTFNISKGKMYFEKYQK